MRNPVKVVAGDVSLRKVIVVLDLGKGHSSRKPFDSRMLFEQIASQ